MNTGLWLLLAGLVWLVGLVIVWSLLYAHGEREANYIEVRAE